MITHIWDGVDSLLVRPSVDENCLYYIDRPYRDEFGLLFNAWFHRRSEEYLEWLPER